MNFTNDILKYCLQGAKFLCMRYDFNFFFLGSIRYYWLHIMKKIIALEIYQYKYF